MQIKADVMLNFSPKNRLGMLTCTVATFNFTVLPKASIDYRMNVPLFQ